MKNYKTNIKDKFCKNNDDEKKNINENFFEACKFSYNNFAVIAFRTFLLRKINCNKILNIK